MSKEDESNNNLYFLALSKNKVTVYEYNTALSKNIIDDINEEIKKDGEIRNSKVNVLHEEDDDNNNNSCSNNNNSNHGSNNNDNNRSKPSAGRKNDKSVEDREKNNLNGTPSDNQLKKSVSKFNDFLINRGINIYKEYNDVEIATCTHDYKKIILVRKSKLNVAEIIDMQNKDKEVIYIKTKTQIKRIVTSPRDNYIVLHCQYKPDVVSTNLYVYKISGKLGKKKKKKDKKDEMGENHTEQREWNKIIASNSEGQMNKRVGDGKGETTNAANTNQKTNSHENNDNKEKSESIYYNEMLICERTLKSYSNKNWPFFKWNESESVCVCLNNSQINIYKDNNLSVPADKLKLDNIEYFDLSPDLVNKKGNLLITYEQGSKGNPSVFKIFNMDNLNKHIYSKNFFNSDEIKIKWNKNGTSLLLQIHTQVDKEKQSYYGSSNLYFIDTVTLKDVNIMTNKGLIYDTIWSYNQNKFYVCKGEIPAEIVVHDKNANVSYSYGRHKYNTLKLNCNEKLLLTGGFGNLSGDISIWNTSNKKEITKTKSSCAVICEFFNDGTHFITATTHPRLRVDNNIKIYKYNGLIVSRINFEELYNVIILPFNKIKFQETDATLGTYVDNSHLQFYINKQLGIDSKKTGIYRAPRSTGLIRLNGNLSSKIEKSKSNLPPGCNFVIEEKTYKKKKKKKKTQRKKKRGRNFNFF
ncbi:eukaryotic translation initiation factor eIF2A, putative [Plasmodium malariae]|uniref:Eukaryotic translation initiation factor 2A n=1 Tax=Plasmodium malariae TaxID=5858 RepID=A0A1D3TCG8_PLAMA|nr:eukaryotic translation initiation factor eIF2A, putative [Plasmodium malariae]SCP02576.1 eukaryotic translation initiation factor eIF2A, putative [Plasmodium malariae]